MNPVTIIMLIQGHNTSNLAMCGVFFFIILLIIATFSPTSTLCEQLSETRSKPTNEETTTPGHKNPRRVVLGCEQVLL